MLPKLQSSTLHTHFLFAVILFYYSASSYQQVCNNQDQSSLLTFLAKISTSSSPLNWSSTVSCCWWEGVACDANGRVIHLLLPSRSLKGTIHSSIGNLIALTRLNLSNNLLSGPLPMGIFRFMDSLELIDLNSNHLSGEFSSSLSSRSGLPLNMGIFDISNNQFHGVIDPSLFSRGSKLTSFNCSNNSFSGPFPSSICVSSPMLKTLDFSHNEFSGPIPRGLEGCSQLEILRAGFNSLYGILPDNISKLWALKEILLPSNHLHGGLGDKIINLTNLRIVKLFSSSFFGMIPQKIGNLLHLEKLYLQDNNLNGPIPPSLMNCTNLSEMILRNNHFDENLSKLDFSRLVHLQKIDLLNNSFFGNLPESIYSCKSMIAIQVAWNNLNGEISDKIVELKCLSFLSLSGNSFTNITRALRVTANCNNLKFLALSSNFYGESLPGDKDFIPSNGFPKLQIFSLVDCNITGGIPEWLSSVKSLRVLDLNYNKITGTIPQWMGRVYQTLFTYF